MIVFAITVVTAQFLSAGSNHALQTSPIYCIQPDDRVEGSLGDLTAMLVLQL